MRPLRTWRPRKDPFEGVWCKALGWLEEYPDAGAVALLERLQETDPDRFNQGHLRTLQRRVQKWRGIMVSKLVYVGSGDVERDPCDLSELAFSMDDLKS